MTLRQKYIPIMPATNETASMGEIAQEIRYKTINTNSLIPLFLTIINQMSSENL